MSGEITGVFFLGTDTEVGKTYHACELARTLVSRKVRVGVFKPAESGVTDSSKSDSQRLLESARLDCGIHRVCPQSFQAPAAPAVAAEMEGRCVDQELLTNGINWWTERCDFLIVEGAGGVMSPLSYNQTVVEFAQEVGLPVILVAANRLGVVNHTLMSLEAIEARGLQTLGIIMNDLPNDRDLNADISKQSNVQLLRKFTSVTVFQSAQELWKAHAS